mgnify:CR=1 FL=1
MNTDWYELIEQYNLGRLPAGQAAQFEAAMRTDPALAAAVRTQRTEWEMQEMLAEKLLRAQIRQGLADLPDGVPDTDRSRWKGPWKYLLPLVLALVTAAYFIFRQPADPAQPVPTPPETPVPGNTPPPALPLPVDTSPQNQKPVAEAPGQRNLRQLALAAYRTPDGLSGIRGAADTDTLSQATRAFAEKNYRRVLALLGTLPADSRQEALSLRAHAHFKTGAFPAASRDFTELEAAGIYRREAQWFGLLSRMATPGADRPALKAELERILATAGHPYRNDAAALLISAFPSR